MKLFAYGTLMVPEVWGKLVPKHRSRRRALLSGYVRRRVRGEVYPGAVRGPAGSSVTGILYEGLEETDLEGVDRFEGGLYERTVASVEPEGGGEIRAYVYVIKEAFRECLSDEDWDEARFSCAEIISEADRLSKAE